MKYPRASRALRWAPDPTLKRAHFAHTTLLHTIGNLGLSRSEAPPDQILDPPLLNVYTEGLINILHIKQVSIVDGNILEKRLWFSKSELVDLNKITS